MLNQGVGIRSPFLDATVLPAPAIEKATLARGPYGKSTSEVGLGESGVQFTHDVVPEGLGQIVPQSFEQHQTGC